MQREVYLLLRESADLKSRRTRRPASSDNSLPPPRKRKAAERSRLKDTHSNSEGSGAGGTTAPTAAEPGTLPAHPSISPDQELASEKATKHARHSPEQGAVHGDACDTLVISQEAHQRRSPLELLAALAAGAVKARSKELQGEGNNQAPPLIKCFHVGVRWGITLSRASLTARSDLATALNNAFAGEILSCGRGEMLYIVFVGREGGVVELPPLMGGKRDRAALWKELVGGALKIYVRR